MLILNQYFNLSVFTSIPLGVNSVSSFLSQHQIRWIRIWVQGHVLLIKIFFLKFQHANHIIAIVLRQGIFAMTRLLFNTFAQLQAVSFELLVYWVIWSCVNHNVHHTTHLLKNILQRFERLLLSFNASVANTVLIIIYRLNC